MATNDTVDDVPPIEQMKRAVSRGDAVELRRVLEQHAEAREAIDAPIFDFDSPAIVASNRQAKVTRVLLDFGADPDRKSEWWAGGFHALYGASPTVAALLIAAGATVDACAAAHLGRSDLLRQLLANDPDCVHQRGGDGQMPLHFASSRDIVDILLEAGADIDARDIDHRSTAAEWMVSDRTDIAHYLVERGAHADIFLAAALGLAERARSMVIADPSLLSLRTGQGEYAEQGRSSFHIYLWTIGSNLTPLQTAAKFGHRKVIDAVAEFATPVARLLLACHEGNADDARRIVREHPGIVEGLKDADRRALTDEAWLPNPNAVELMLVLGFDPAAPSKSGPTGGTALHNAAWQGSVDAVAALLRYPSGRALINAVEDTFNGTPLSWTCHGSRNCHRKDADHAGVARLLVAAGAHVKPDWTECSDEVRAVLYGVK